MLRSTAPLILASTSGTRKLLCESIGLPVHYHAPRVDEDALKATLPAMAPAELARVLAEAKAMSVSEIERDAYVIGADQICAQGTRIFGKSKNAETALEHLLALQGAVHYQHSGYAIARAGRIITSGTTDTLLRMHPWDADALMRYIAAEEPFQSAGSYKFESIGRLLFAEVQGTTDQIMGLPLSPILNALLSLEIVSF